MEDTFGSILFYGFAFVVVILIICAVFGCFISVEQQTARIVSRFGKFVKVCSAGLSFKFPFIDAVSDAISLRTEQLEVVELTYTDKGTSVTIAANVQYYVDENDSSVQLAYYKLANPKGQISSHVSSAIRAKVPTMSLEAVQNNQAQIASHVKTELTEIMRQYGYVISDVLITKADPDASVVKANNDKYASEQAKETAKNIAEANKTRVVESAKADAEAMKLHGQGIAEERAAIVLGLQESVTNFETAVPGATAADAMRMVLFQQYVDTMAKLGASAGSKIVFMPSGGNAPSDLMAQLANGVMVGMEAAKPGEDAKPAEAKS